MTNVGEIEWPDDRDSDLDMLIRAFDCLAIKYRITTFDSGKRTVTIEAKDGERVKGYAGFYASFEFDGEEFLEVGIWE